MLMYGREQKEVWCRDSCRPGAVSRWKPFQLITHHNLEHVAGRRPDLDFLLQSQIICASTSYVLTNGYQLPLMVFLRKPVPL
jgi:hypothetical protein